MEEIPIGVSWVFGCLQTNMWHKMIHFTGWPSEATYYKIYGKKGAIFQYKWTKTFSTLNRSQLEIQNSKPDIVTPFKVHCKLEVFLSLWYVYCIVTQNLPMKPRINTIWKYVHMCWQPFLHFHSELGALLQN